MHCLKLKQRVNTMRMPYLYGILEQSHFRALKRPPRFNEFAWRSILGFISRMGLFAHEDQQIGSGLPPHIPLDIRHLRRTTTAEHFVQRGTAKARITFDPAGVRL